LRENPLLLKNHKKKQRSKHLDPAIDESSAARHAHAMVGTARGVSAEPHHELKFM
jgi:hypothetical protein